MQESRLSPSLHEAAQAAGVRFSEPAQPREGWFSSQGLRLHYLAWGDPSARPFLLLHGGYQTAHSWDFFALAMQERLHVVALDQRGHGDSDWSPDHNYSAEASLHDIETLVAELGLERFLLAGLSMGGRNAFTYAATHPEAVEALIIVDVGPEIRKAGVNHIRRFVTQSDELPTLEDFVIRAHRFNPRRSLEQYRGSLRHNLKQLPDGKWTWKYDAALRDRARWQGRETAATTDAWGLIRAIQCPTLVVHGEESDVFSKRDASRLAAELADGTLTHVPGASHLVMGDNPIGFEAAVRSFLVARGFLEQ